MNIDFDKVKRAWESLASEIDRYSVKKGKMFGSQTLGKIGDISINGLDINLLVVHRYSLLCIAVIFYILILLIFLIFPTLSFSAFSQLVY